MFIKLGQIPLNNHDPLGNVSNHCVIAAMRKYLHENSPYNYIFYRV